MPYLEARLLCLQIIVLSSLVLIAGSMVGYLCWRLEWYDRSRAMHIKNPTPETGIGFLDFSDFES